MLSYQHHYHAGNHADVLKHWVLLECILYMQKKDKPFDYIDTHAGAGIYDLDSTLARKTAEADDGVLKNNLAKIAGLEHYFSILSPFLEQRQYPGSPAIVKSLLRKTDKAFLYELHPQTIVELLQHCKKYKQVFVQQQDGFKALPGLLPNDSRRAVVLIDPSYEIKSDYQTVVKVMSKAYQKMANVQLLLWYPVVNRDTVDRLEHDLVASGMKNIQLFEMGVAEDDDKGMTASGMVVVNPPWTLAEKFNQVMPEVSALLSTDGKTRVRFKQLVVE